MTKNLFLLSLLILFGNHSLADFYIKVQGGWNKTNAINITSDTKLESRRNAFFGVGIGYYLRDNMRVDFSLDHSFKPEHKKMTSGKEFEAKGNINTFLLNGFVDVIDLSGLKIFLGAGIGTSQNKCKLIITEGDFTRNFDAAQKYAFTFAGYLGASYNFAPGIVGEITYSYRDLGSTKALKNSSGDSIGSIKYRGSNISLGVRFDV